MYYTQLSRQRQLEEEIAYLRGQTSFYEDDGSDPIRERLKHECAQLREEVEYWRHHYDPTHHYGSLNVPKNEEHVASTTLNEIKKERDNLRRHIIELCNRLSEVYEDKSAPADNPLEQLNKLSGGLMEEVSNSMFYSYSLTFLISM